MTTRLELYNRSLLLCGERFLASLEEEREPRRLLDHVWDTGWVKACLEKGFWHFAMRNMRIESDPDYEAEYGLRYSFTVPEDWVATDAVCGDEWFKVPLVDSQYLHEVGQWYADIDPIYVKYISNDDAYGNDLAKWPESFADHAAAHGAAKIIGKLSGDKTEQVKLLFGKDGILDRTLFEAKKQAARTQPTRFPAEGNWTRARRGRHGGGRFRDGGTSGSLIG